MLPRQHLLGYLLGGLAVLLAADAGAGPDSCLSLRENAAVANCANQYAPAGRGPALPRTPPPALAPAGVVAANTDNLMAVPVPTRQAPSTARAEPDFSFSSPEHYQFILNGMAIAGIAGFVVLGAVGWFWRRRDVAVRRCPYCSAKVRPNVHVCKTCFRVI